ncbi:MAG TPA: glutaminase A [Candidatus Binatia bacterium]
MSPILSSLQEMHAKYRQDFAGKVATYIPELAKADPHRFGIALATVDGEIYEVGDARHLFTIQSISKPFVYGLALEDHGQDYVVSKVGVEPSGDAFNSIVFDVRGNRPFNPMVNAGAIATAALIRGAGHDRRLARLLKMFSDFAGRPVAIDRDVFLSEKATGHRNRAIAYLGLNSGMIDERIDEHLDLYFEQCSILVSARDLAVMAATLANNGVNPLTRERAIEERYVKNVLSVMHSCGMYDYAGEWGYRVGLPAKSGVGGGILAVLPGQFGIGTFSPLLDERGNSRRGIQVCEELSERFNLHMFRTRPGAATVIRRGYRGGSVRSKRRRSRREQSILAEKAGSVCVYELQGDLFFGTMEQVFRRLMPEMESFEYLILDFKRIVHVDDCAAALLGQMSEALALSGKRLAVSYPPAAIRPVLGEGQAGKWKEEAFFPDTDAALEWCENRLVAGAETRDGRERVLALADMDVVAGMDAGAVALLQSAVSEVRYDAGAVIVREGDPADSIFLLAAGRATVRLKLGDGPRSKRLGTITPGVAFGELALFDGGTRSADVVADAPSVCYVLPIAALDDLAARDPEIRAKLLRNVGRELSERLRRADAEIRALEE